MDENTAIDLSISKSSSKSATTPSDGCKSVERLGPSIGESPIQIVGYDEMSELSPEQVDYLLERARFQNARRVGRSGPVRSARIAGMALEYEDGFQIVPGYSGVKTIVFPEFSIIPATRWRDIQRSTKPIFSGDWHARPPIFKLKGDKK